jgi:hypothetical protein
VRPRIRTLKPEFYGDELVCAISRDARLTTVGLISAADDRGRLEFSVPAIRGFVFPRDKLSDRHVARWIAEITGIGIAVVYEVTWPYLWLPNFWKHQVINRPTESVLPPHPDDPYGEFPVAEAMKKFREDSVVNHGGLTPSRAGARSSSISLPGVDVRTTPTDVAREARKVIDQDQLPDDFDLELSARALEVLAVLLGVQAERGGTVPTLRGVGLAMRRFPGRDHLRVVRELEHWALAGTGQRKTVRDWARTFGTFLDGSEDATPSRSGNGNGGRPKASVAKRNELMGL